MILYQFAISHYCEKARWALDYKNLSYQVINLLPGPHLFTTKRLTGQTSVPVLNHNGKNIHDSTAILSYLDEITPEKSLTPQAETLRKEALELEDYLDQEIGIHLRRFFYHTYLENRKEVTSFILHNGPRYGPLLYAFIFPLIKKVMKKGMRINKESAARSEKRLTNGLHKLNKILSQNQFLVGNKFSRADLTAAALLAPLCAPQKHPFPWPATLLEPLESFKKAHSKEPFFKWVLKMYAEYR